jgi:hypothetical protein
MPISNLRFVKGHQTARLDLNNYFGFPEGFNTLFTTTSQIDINGGIFDASAMVNIMHYSALNASGEYVNTMTGSITIEHINALLMSGRAD